MSMRVRFFPVVISVLTFLSTQSFAQSVARHQADATPQQQSANPPQNANSIDAVANEISLLRKSLQTLNARLGEISARLLAPDAKQSDVANDKQNRIALNMDLLARAEDRAGVLRKQLIELIEKETAYKSRLTQLEEDMRQENIERSMSGAGTTRTPEMRDNRRRVLENERRGLESLLNLTTQSRIKVEEDVRQADSLVARLRQRLLPLIDKEIEKINPN